jgi:hypothetical protein
MIYRNQTQNPSKIWKGFIMFKNRKDYLEIALEITVFWISEVPS